MPAAIVHRAPGDGRRHAVAEVRGVCHVLVAAEPRAGGTLREQTRDALEAAAEAMAAEGAGGAVVHQTVFLADPAAVAAARQVVRDFYGPDLPATSYVPQPPCDGRLVAVEAIGLGRGRDGVEVERHSEQVVTARHAGATWVYVAHAVPRTSAPGVYERTVCGYQQLRRLLPKAGARMDQVVRTWLALGGIVDDDGPTQRYKELNRARADVYDHVHFLADWRPDDAAAAYPASTGIGTAGRNVELTAVAVVADAPDVAAVPLENPRQTAAYDYAPVYSPASPRFSRGLALCEGPDTTLFISGTASITHSETRHRGDVAAQTEETLDNIAALVADDNLARHGLPGRGATLADLGAVRVYVKHRADYPRVRAVCDRRLGPVPATYVVADVCRPDLLVEIEGMAFSRAANPAPLPVPARRPLPEAGCGWDGRRAPYCPAGCPERGVCPHAVIPADRREARP